MTNALILIIEDEPEIADILRHCFEREGVRTVSAGEGETGLSHHLRLKADPALFASLVGHVDSMARLVEDLRILGMFSASKLELTRQSVELAEKVAARLRSGRMQAVASLLKCSCRFPSVIMVHRTKFQNTHWAL